jgi:hypothetical protein
MQKLLKMGWRADFSLTEIVLYGWREDKFEEKLLMVFRFFY